MSRVLVVNSGSSTLKYQLLDPDTRTRYATGHADGIGLDGAIVKHTVAGRDPVVADVPLPDHAAALSAMGRAVPAWAYPRCRPRAR